MTPSTMRTRAENLHWQTNPDLLPQVQQYGCIWMDLKAPAQLWADIYFTPQDFNAMWEEDKKSGLLTMVNGYWLALIPDHARIVEAGYLRLTGKASQCALVDATTFDRGDLVGPSQHFSFWDGKRDFTILAGLTQNGGTHFRLGDSKGTEVYNTWPSLPILKELQLRSYKFTICEED